MSFRFSWASSEGNRASGTLQAFYITKKPSKVPLVEFLAFLLFCEKVKIDHVAKEKELRMREASIMTASNLKRCNITSFNIVSQGFPEASLGKYTLT